MTAKLIKSIKIRGLFGLYNYNLPNDDDEFSNATILYGDNGTGKSTILRLAFHLLSASNSRGHRTALYNSDFERLEVDLASDIKLTASFNNTKSKRDLILEVLDKDRKLVVWEYSPDKENHLIDTNDLFINIHIPPTRTPTSQKKHSLDTILKGNSAYINILCQHAPTMFIIDADRRLDSDTISDPSDEMELRRVMRYEEPKRIKEMLVRSREIGLSQALSAAARWISQKAVIGTNQGSMNVHSVYTDVLQHILSTKSVQQNQEAEKSVSILLERLDIIENMTAQHSRYELATKLSITEFRNALKRKSKKSDLAVELLNPYIKSLQGRLEAVEPIYKIIDRFVTIVNNLLRDKSISFRLSQGFSIHNKLGTPLTPAQLSSGEQQLLLLFCYVLTARDIPSVFMIDEPEISLNVKWQRLLIQSLLDITEGAQIQFIFASHSIELLSQHRNRVVKMVNIIL